MGKNGPVSRLIDYRLMFFDINLFSSVTEVHCVYVRKVTSFFFVATFFQSDDDDICTNNT